MVGDPAGLVKVRDVPRTNLIWPLGRWEYEPVGRCSVDMLTETLRSGPMMFEDYDTLEHAVDRMVERLLPQIYGAIATITDEMGVQVLHYDMTLKARRQRGPYGWWCGVQRAFELLEQRWDPMEVAVWETMARETD